MLDSRLMIFTKPLDVIAGFVHHARLSERVLNFGEVNTCPHCYEIQCDEVD